MKVLIVSANASMKMGGEASLPLYYFKLLQLRNIETWMICHERVKEELRQIFPDDRDFQRIEFVNDTTLQITVWRLSRYFPERIKDLILGQIIHIATQIQIRKIVKKQIEKLSIDIVFEPSPISPKGVSFMYGFDVPVVIGPLCGGIDFPPAFRYMDSPLSRFSMNISRVLSLFIHHLFPGKLQADALIVANSRTETALPKGYQGKIYEVVESGVDLSIWQQNNEKNTLKSFSNEQVHFVYSGRFVDWKGIQFLLEAFKQVAPKNNTILHLIGDGILRQEIEKTLISSPYFKEKVTLHGWLSREESAKIIRQCDVFIMPSLRECGGTAILEAMALGLPVIATNWLGPASYLNSTCGILIEPTSKEGFVKGLADAMIQVSQSEELRHQMGEEGRKRILNNCFDWDAKVNRIIEIFQETLENQSS
jgi:glycosyltransferase involved in cell wall biosynthesis